MVKTSKLIEATCTECGCTFTTMDKFIDGYEYYCPKHREYKPKLKRKSKRKVKAEKISPKEWCCICGTGIKGVYCNDCKEKR